jgi:threonine/homoserine/homoserine lactone efflux protein
MTSVPLFLKALGIGLAVAAPVGPMSLLCMRRTLTQSPGHGLATGAGIALGDAAYAAVAALGLAGVSAFMLKYDQPLHVAAGLFLLWLGLKSFLKANDATAAERADQPWLKSLASSFLLTMTNPPTIIMFAAIFVAMAPKEGFTPAGAAITVAGVFAGSMVWWLGVVAAVSTVRHAIGARARRWIDRVSGAVLMAFGAVELNRAIRS